MAKTISEQLTKIAENLPRLVDIDKSIKVSKGKIIYEEVYDEKDKKKSKLDKIIEIISVAAGKEEDYKQKIVTALKKYRNQNNFTVFIDSNLNDNFDRYAKISEYHQSNKSFIGLGA